MRSQFIALDGIRGVAAIFVLYHHAEASFGFHLGRSYLAVDLFFMLSGFVIAHSYDHRLSSGQLSPGAFMRIRWIRLYPMYLISALLTLMIHRDARMADVMRGVAMWPRLGAGDMYPLNAVYWTLLFEIVVNALYGCTRARIGDRWLLRISIASAALLLLVSRQAGGLNVGFYGTPYHIVGGFLRAVFGIALGLYLYRRRDRLVARVARIRPWQPMVLICLALASPGIGRFNYLADWALVVCLFPIVIVAAAVVGRPGFARLQMALGTASYPLYVIHTPLAWWVLERFPAFMREQAPLSGVLLILGVLAFAWMLETFIDLPIRRWLARRLVPAAPRRPAPEALDQS